jgi:outer membrane lipoprotein-sorting protein
VRSAAPCPTPPRGAFALAAVLALASAAALRAASDPSELLATARDRLAAEPRVADFTQTFVPAGFASGESESGSVALALPDRARWDYHDPFPRTFLVDGEIVFAWNEGERTGRRFALAADEAEHLDLLRLDVEELARRYAAEISSSGEAEVVIRLMPAGGEAPLAAVSLALRRADLLPAGLAYEDREGNRTRFGFSAFQPLDGTERFLPPDIEWLMP